MGKAVVPMTMQRDSSFVQHRPLYTVIHYLPDIVDFVFIRKVVAPVEEKCNIQDYCLRLNHPGIHAFLFAFQ